MSADLNNEPASIDCVIGTPAGWRVITETKQDDPTSSLALFVGVQLD